MPYYACIFGGGKQPTVTITGTISASYNQTGSNNAGGSVSGTGSGNVTIPTMGYKKADISGGTGLSANVGTGTGIDISQISEIELSISFKTTDYYHESSANDKSHWGNGTCNYSVSLHN